MASGKLLVQGILLLLLVAALLRLRLPVRTVTRGLRGIASLLAFVLVANALWYLAAHEFGWDAGGALVRPAAWSLLLLRLANLGLLGGWLAASTDAADAAAAAEGLLRPLGKLYAPLAELGLTVALALGFLPLLRDEAGRLSLALQLRQGKRLPRAWERLRLAVPLVVQLFVGVLRRSDEVALALEARAFDARSGRTSFTGARCGGRELLLVAAAGLLFGLAIYY